MKLTLRHFTLLSFAVVAVSVVGCGQAPPPRFQLNAVSMVSQEISDESQQEIANVLAALFGTPDEPFVFADPSLEKPPLDQTRLKLAAGPTWRSDEGVSHGLYRRHCVHCHGITGDGRGPTARFLNPYPRDYRKGAFKFKSTVRDAKPTDADLTRVLHNGIPGTSMPAFSTLPPAEVEALVEYVKYLAMRGEMEARLVGYVASDLGEEAEVDAEGNELFDEDGNPKMKHLALDPVNSPEQADVVKEEFAGVVTAWQEAADKVVAPKEEEIPAEDRSPEEIAASVALGRELFYSANKGNCFNCHGTTGLGDGQQTEYDDWGKDQKALIDAIDQMTNSIANAEEADEISEEEERRLEDDRAQLARLQLVNDTLYPLRTAIPRNLRKGVYRGGRRRIDVFHRMHQGIAGSPMPGVASTLTEKELWSIVDYVMTLPYEAISNPQPALIINSEEITN